MPEDSLPIARAALGGQFYGIKNPLLLQLKYSHFLLIECPRGHPYHVSEV